MALVVKTDWKMQDIVTPEQVNRIEGNIGTLETDLSSGLNSKVDKVAGKGLSTLDFTTTFRDKINTSESKITALESNKLNVMDFTKTNILSKLGTDEVNLNVSKLQGKSASDFLAVGGKAVDSAKLNGAVESISGVADTIAKRTSTGHIVAVEFQEGTLLLKDKYASKSATAGHISSTNNPHSVTKAQVGLNFVENLPVATSAEIIQGTIKKYITSDELSVALDEMTVGTANESANSAMLNNKGESSSPTPNTIVSRNVSGNISAVEFLEGNTKLSEKYLGINATAVDSAKLGGKLPSEFLGRTAKAVDSDKLDGKDSTEFAPAEHNHDTKYLGKSDKAADSAKLDGYEQSHSNDAGKIVRRSSVDGNIYVGPVYEDGTKLADKYLGKSAKAADSAKLDGYEQSISTDSPNTIVRRTSASAINAKVFYEDGSSLANRYAAKVLYGTGAPPSTLAPGQIYIQY